MVLGVLTNAEKLRLGWYDGCQATVWDLGMIVEIHSPYMVFSELEQARKLPTRIQKHLTPGNFINLFYLPNSRTKHLWAMSYKDHKVLSTVHSNFCLNIIIFGYSGSSTCFDLDLKISPSSVTFSR